MSSSVPNACGIPEIAQIQTAASHRTHRACEIPFDGMPLKPASIGGFSAAVAQVNQGVSGKGRKVAGEKQGRGY